MKDRWGRSYEHYGFLDDKHKHAGKTMAEVLGLEFEERRTKDDDLEIMYIFNNRPIEVGFANVFDSIGEKGRGVEIVENTDYPLIKYPQTWLTEIGIRKRPKYIKEICFKRKAIDVVDINKASKQVTFPIHAVREKEAVNKIEELTEFLHIKKIGFEYRQLEFFIPLHFKTSELDDDSDIFKEIIDIQQVFIRDEYGEMIGFGINKYNKRIIYNDTHEVLKFDGIEMQTVGAPR